MLPKLSFMLFTQPVLIIAAANSINLAHKAQHNSLISSACLSLPTLVVYGCQNLKDLMLNLLLFFCFSSGQGLPIMQIQDFLVI